MHGDFDMTGMMGTPVVADTPNATKTIRDIYRRENPQDKSWMLQTPDWLMDLLRGSDAVAARLPGLTLHRDPMSVASGQAPIELIVDILTHELAHEGQPTRPGDLGSENPLEWFERPEEQEALLAEQRRREKRGLRIQDFVR